MKNVMTSKNRQTQGDVQLRPCVIPAGAEPFDAKMTLAYGEVTGHAHRVVPQVSGTVEFLKLGARTFFRAKSGVEITHEEHNPGLGRNFLPPGDYEYGLTREYDYDEMESRRVAD